MRHVEEYSRREQAASPDAIYAEIVHLPQERVGNILARPVLTDYEIVFLGQSGMPLENQIYPGADELCTQVEHLTALDEGMKSGGLLPEEEDHLDEFAVLTKQRIGVMH